MHQQKLEFDNLFDKALNFQGLEQTQLLSACRYSALNKGKRLRPILVYTLGRVLEIEQHLLHGIALSIESIHAYSLIHDDLPAMDDDDLRRGIPTCHKAYDEATAILAGDALQTFAFELLTDITWNPHSPDVQIAMIKSLTRASGMHGMILGQALDINSCNNKMDLVQLTNMHSLKTGALFKACIEMTMLASAKTLASSLRNKLVNYAYHIGLAFQIKDDILDVIGEEEIIGKEVGSDLDNDKTTFVTLLGLEKAHQHLSNNLNQAYTALSDLGPKAQPLIDLADFIVARNQ